MSLTQGVSWQLLGYAPFATRYHAKMVAASNGVLLLGGGATDALPTNGGASQAPDVNLNDLWASLDGGFTWGQCSAQLFPFSGNASAYPRGTGRQDFLMQLDPATGIVYVGAGQGRDQTGSQVFFNDLYRLPISLYSVNALAAACNLTVPAKIGLSIVPNVTTTPPSTLSSSSSSSGAAPVAASSSSGSSGSSASTPAISSGSSVSSSSGAVAAGSLSSSSSSGGGGVAPTSAGGGGGAVISSSSSSSSYSGAAGGSSSSSG